MSQEDTCLLPWRCRHKGGASSVQALVWNVGTPRPDRSGRVLDRPARGRTPSSGNCEGQSTDAGQAGGPSRRRGGSWGWGGGEGGGGPRVVWGGNRGGGGGRGGGTK